jgi:acyl-CoA-binding protein
MSKSCHESFECAAKAIRESDKEPSLQKVTKEERMRLYGLYKQATEGDCTTSKPVENVES